MMKGKTIACVRRSPMAKAVLASVGFTLALGLTPLAEAQQAQSIDGIAAVVNQDAIMRGELEQRMRQVRDQLAQNGVQPPNEDQLRRQVLERMIVEQIQLQMASRANLSVDDNQLNAALREVAERNQMTLDQFADTVESEGLSFADVREQIRREMLISQVQQGSVGSQVRVTDGEVDQYLENANAAAGVEYHIAHILVPLPENPTDEQVAAARARIDGVRRDVQGGQDFATAAAGNSSDGQAFEGGDLGWRSQADMPSLFAGVVPNMTVGDVSQPIRSASGFHLIKLLERRGGNQTPQIIEQYQARHILISPNPIRSSEQAQQLALELRDRILNGEDFAALAREYSNDRGTALAGGELGWVSDRDTVPAFDAVLKSAPLGELSQPVQTQYGWHLIEVEDRRQQDITVQTQREQARRALFQRKAEDQLEGWLQEIRAEAYVDNRLYPNDPGIGALMPTSPGGQP
ncbi:hypothetical protein A5892_14595 [Halotalea alkalilenta]|uniref:Chaperone SurA n=2 Tax=Halotalea alkalilenta TaxID=376489 RepID=A0A172YH04_9GAMM|nr:hypothetical protein A5892_14595 [Halotalea alkalilenta]